MTFIELRKLSGMNQKQFCEYFKIPSRTVQHWEAGTRQCPEYLLELMEYKLEQEGITAKEHKMNNIVNDVARTEISTRKILELQSQGMNISEIAEAIGCTKYTVRNRLKSLNLI